MQDMDKFTVAIVGGGIGGLCCALSVAHHCPGIHIDVYEQAPEYREIGAGIGIGVNASKILHRLGVGKTSNAISGERNHIHRTMRRFDNGEEIVTIGADFDDGDVRQLSVHRAEFLDVLYRQIKETGIATLHTDKRCVDVVEGDGDVVVLSFQDGSSAKANMVVAARWDPLCCAWCVRCGQATVQWSDCLPRLTSIRSCPIILAI